MVIMMIMTIKTTIIIITIIIIIIRLIKKLSRIPLKIHFFVVFSFAIVQHDSVIYSLQRLSL